jgi:hypothetical protein
LKRSASLRMLARFLLACVLLLIGAIGAEIALGWHCELQAQISPSAQQPSERKAATAGIKDYLRPEDDTYLSYPEWYIVWSYQEKADFQESHLPSGFPYFSAVRQYWNSYCCISRMIRGRYAFNGGEQLMLVVIGTSFSAEYILKGVYEKTIGKLSEWTSGRHPVEEDHYSYQVARDYADFVDIRPFYEFRFARHVRGLWSKTPLWGVHPVRKWERKIFLTFDYALEAFYCWLIQKATHLTYGDESADTYAWIDNVNETALRQLPHVKKVKQVGPQALIVDVPRYQEFTAIASALAERDAHFVEIAGNSHITVSVLAAKSWRYGHSDAPQLFSNPVITHLGMQRVVLDCDVTSLHAVLNTLHADGVTIEHIYDY